MGPNKKPKVEKETLDRILKQLGQVFGCWISFGTFPPFFSKGTKTKLARTPVDNSVIQTTRPTSFDFALNLTRALK